MKAIIVDDEPHNIENLQIILNKNFPWIEIAGWADNNTDAVSIIGSVQPDLLFLDIQMGAGTGFEVLQAIPERCFEVIFVTAYDQYGIQAIKYAALDYILKPVDIAELTLAVNKAREKIELKQRNVQLDFLIDHIRGNRKPAKIALPQMHEVRYVSVDDIVRCEAQNTYTFFYLLAGDKILVSKPLKEYEELLLPHGFVRCHQTHLVNTHYVKSYLKEDGGSLLLQNGVKIPVSKTKKELVKKVLLR
ncbi:LytR/AlgR family response regulator transcription factor [Niabella aquatica]